jgi:hypothetical protein
LLIFSKILFYLWEIDCSPDFLTILVPIWPQGGDSFLLFAAIFTANHQHFLDRGVHKRKLTKNNSNLGPPKP